MSAPVEVVIAVHTPERPISRAARSVLDDNGRQAVLTIVAHNIGADEIAARLDPDLRPRVRFLEHRDGVPSPAGPFNAGMAAARGDYVSIMGSDDTLAPGAIDSWVTTAWKSGADTVITRLELAGAKVPTPPRRPRRRPLMDPVADRVSYRSAPLGLVSVAATARLGTALAEGLPVGSDVPYVTRLWFETEVAYDDRGPAYRIGEDAGDRVTYETRPVADSLACIPAVLDADWFATYPWQWQRAVVIKLARIHLFGAVWNRRDQSVWGATDRQTLAVVSTALDRAAPGFDAPLSRADRALLRACRDPQVPDADLVAAAIARRRHGRPATLISGRLASWADREAPPRFMAASLLNR